MILMDVRMPIMDGYETARLIRARSQSVPTPIIFLTAFGRDEAETAGAYASGAVDFLFAPIAPDGAAGEGLGLPRSSTPAAQEHDSAR